MLKMKYKMLNDVYFFITIMNNSGILISLTKKYLSTYLNYFLKIMKNKL